MHTSFDFVYVSLMLKILPKGVGEVNGKSFTV